MEGSLPLRVVTYVCTLLDYVRGNGHCPKSWMEPFPLLDGTRAGKGEPILVTVPPETKASGLHKAKQWPTNNSICQFRSFCLVYAYVPMSCRKLKQWAPGQGRIVEHILSHQISVWM